MHSWVCCHYVWYMLPLNLFLVVSDVIVACIHVYILFLTPPPSKNDGHIVVSVGMPQTCAIYNWLGTLISSNMNMLSISCQVSRSRSMPFLAHLSQRLKWDIVIVHRPSSVRPSVHFHIFNFFSRTAWWILMKLGRDEVLMVPYKCCYTSRNEVRGVYWNHPVRPSVCRRARLGKIGRLGKMVSDT